MTLLASAPVHAAVNTSSSAGAGLLCTILLFATVVALILGLVQVLGLDGGRLGVGVGGRFGGVVVFVVLLLGWIFFCQ